MCGCFSAHRISGRLRLRTAPSSRTSVFLTDEQIKGRKTASKHGGKHTHKRTKQILRSTCRVSALLLGSRAPERNISSQRVQREYTQHVHLCVCECVCAGIYIYIRSSSVFCSVRPEREADALHAKTASACLYTERTHIFRRAIGRCSRTARRAPRNDRASPVVFCF